MGLWIAIAVTLLVLGSVLWVMPSARDKMLTEVRQKALAHGTKVRLLDQKLASSLFPWLDDFRGYVLYEKYFAANPRQVKFPSYAIRLSEHEPESEFDLPDPLKSCLDETALAKNLPASAEALAFFPRGVALLWRESGETEVVERIDRCLQGCLETASLWPSQASGSGTAEIN